MGLVKDYSDVDDKEGNLAYEMFRIILAHDGMNKARLWLQTAAMKGSFAAIQEFVEAGNYPSISAWKDSVEGIVANDGLRLKVHIFIFGSFQPIPVPKDLDEDVMKWDRNSVSYRIAEAVRCYNNGDYAGFVTNYLKSRESSREMDYYSLAIIHKGLGMEKDTDLARNIPIKDGYLDSEIIRKKLAEGFNLTPWGEPLTD